MHNETQDNKGFGTLYTKSRAFLSLDVFIHEITHSLTPTNKTIKILEVISQPFWPIWEVVRFAELNIPSSVVNTG